MIFNNVFTRRYLSTATSLPYKKYANLHYDLFKPQMSMHGKLPIHCQEPIVFLHGIYGYSKTFNSDYQQLSNLLQTPIYSVDMRCHGETENCLPFTYNTLADDLDNFVITHNIKKPSLIGYSLGAKLAMLVMLKSPHLYTSAVAVDNVPIRQPVIKPNLASFGNAVINAVFNAGIRRHDLSWISKSFNAMKEHCGDMSVNLYLLQNLKLKPSYLKNYTTDGTDDGLFCKLPIKELAPIVIENVPDWPVEELEGVKSDLPLLVIKASSSGFVNAKGVAALKKHFTDFSIVEIAGTHLVMKERPQEYINAIGKWFFERNCKRVAEMQAEAANAKQKLLKSSVLGYKKIEAI